MSSTLASDLACASMDFKFQLGSRCDSGKFISRMDYLTLISLTEYYSSEIFSEIHETHTWIQLSGQVAKWLSDTWEEAIQEWIDSHIPK